MKQPVDHILRPQLPWRTAIGITECGLDASKVSALSREQYFARHKELGMQRCAMLTCMTCSQTTRSWGTWEDDPRKALGREIEWETRWSRDDRGELLRDELIVIAAMIAERPAEFAAALEERIKRRDWLKQKAEHAKARGANK